jgi:hypothetical protein
VISNVTRRRKGYAALNGDIGEASKIQVQIFKLRGPCAAKVCLNTAANYPSVLVEIGTCRNINCIYEYF